MEAGLPNITGSSSPFDTSGFLYDSGDTIGAFYKGAQKSYITNVGPHLAYNLGFDASLSSSIYGSSNTVTPLSESTLILMKY